MKTSSLLEALNKTEYLESFLIPLPLVAAGGIISNNLDWSYKFNEAKNAYSAKDYRRSASIFSELDKSLPGYAQFLTPAKINETFCWLRIGRFLDYIEFYEPLVKKNKVYMNVLWNLAIAYCRENQFELAIRSIDKWFDSPNERFISNGYLFKSALQFRNGRVKEATELFERALGKDKGLSARIITRFVKDIKVDTLDSNVVAKEETIAALERLMIPKAPGKSPIIAQLLTEFEYQAGYIAVIEKFGDGDIDGALDIIQRVLKGNGENAPFVWAKAACLLSKREWDNASKLLHHYLDDPTVPRWVHWNAACAFFHQGEYKSAFEAMQICLESEYRTSALAWLTLALLAHLCGLANRRNQAVVEAKLLSPRQLFYYTDTLRHIGIDLGGLPTDEIEVNQKIADHNNSQVNNEVVKKAKVWILKKDILSAAQEYSKLAPPSIVDIPEIEDATFAPAILPTCPAELYDNREFLIRGKVAYQRQAYEEAAHSFETFYSKTKESLFAAVNLGAALIQIENYSRSIEVLLKANRESSQRNTHILRNLISAYARSGRYAEAFPYFSKLLVISNKDFFNYVQEAYIADLIGQNNDVATSLYNACTENLTDLSSQLKGAAIKACLEVRDNERAKALIRYFVDDVELPYVVAGRTRPRMTARLCLTNSGMNRQYISFNVNKDSKAAMAYFQEVHLAREFDYANTGQALGLVSACLFYAKSLMDNRITDKAHEVSEQGINLLIDHAEQFTTEQFDKRYCKFVEIYYRSNNYFCALDFCERALEINGGYNSILQFQKEIEQKISKISEKAREAIRELAELQLAELRKAEDLIKQLPKISQLISVLLEEFPNSKATMSGLAILRVLYLT